ERRRPGRFSLGGGGEDLLAIPRRARGAAQGRRAPQRSHPAEVDGVMAIQAVQDLRRLREISAVVARHGFGELWDRAKIWDVLGRREEGKRPSPEELRATTARRFRETLAELGPTFIKLGQILSSRPDILPKGFIDELSLLQDNASPMPVELVFEL